VDDVVQFLGFEMSFADYELGSPEDLAERQLLYLARVEVSRAKARQSNIEFYVCIGIVALVAVLFCLAATGVIKPA
jgi:hypothetical protein